MRSLYEELEVYNKQRPYPFHMPGHKGNPAFLPPIQLAHLDVTELENTDNLHKPTSCIKETERRISKLYGADASFLLVNGSTAGIVAAICAICGEGDLIAVARNCHKAVYSGMILSGAMPVYFWPGRGEIPKAKAVVVTSPTYEGFVLDIEAIAQEVHSWGGVLIVDEAHGAHFPFHEIFPKGALLQGADVVVHSFHKTLPAFSQSAVLHVNGLDITPFRRQLSYIQTSSPSYLIMAATDYMLNTLQSSKHYFESYVENLLNFRKTATDLLIPNDDISKLILTNPKIAQTPGLAFEMTTNEYTIAMTSVADTAEGFKKLKHAIKGVKGTSPLTGLVVQRTLNCSPMHPGLGAEPLGFTLPKVALSPKQAMSKKMKKARIKESIGEISGSFVAPFPPGIPLLAPGEVIGSEHPDCEIEIILL